MNATCTWLIVTLPEGCGGRADCANAPTENMLNKRANHKTGRRVQLGNPA
jgi:hypothetical protein